MIYSQSWLLLLVWLWSEIIGPEFPPEGEVVPSFPVQIKTAPSAPPATERFALKSAQMDNGQPIDAQAFQAAFKRQAGTSLPACLGASLAAPGSVMMSAQLEKSGKLRLVRAIDGTVLPDCASQAIEAMEFASLTTFLATESQHIQWRLDF